MARILHEEASRMRLPLIPPSALSDEQRPLYADMRAAIEQKFRGFSAMRADGALLGPWNPWLHQPKFGGPIWELSKAFFASSLPSPVREVATLVTGARFRASYAIYAHVLIAEQRGLADDVLATIAAGQRPPNLSREESIAYDIASALAHGGVLPEISYRQAVEAFGEQGAAELIYLVGLYCLASVTLNGFDVPIPEQQE
jgi:alkylhydroperoxidase family enzyme